MIARLDDETDVVVSAGKSGVVLGVDPDSGKELWRTPIGRHANDELTALTGPTVVAPGTYGGVLTLRQRWTVSCTSASSTRP